MNSTNPRNLMSPTNPINLIILCFTLFAICSMLCLPYKLCAQPPVTYVDSITEDEEGDRIHFPSTIFAEPVMKEIYIIDSKSRIMIYTSDFFPIFTIDRSNGVESPLSLTVDRKGNLYVIQSQTKDNPRHRISVFNACLKWERDIYLKGFEGAEAVIPIRLIVDVHGNIYVIGVFYPGVIILNNQGDFIEIISPVEGDKKVTLANVNIDGNGRIYLISEEEGHIYVYDENKKFLFKFGEKGGSSGKLSRPQAVGVDNRNGRMYVVDYMRHTISAYDKDGKYLFEFGGLGWGEGWFQYPRDITVDSIGRILVADTFNDRIQIFQPHESQEAKE